MDIIALDMNTMFRFHEHGPLENGLDALFVDFSCSSPSWSFSSSLSILFFYSTGVVHRFATKLFSGPSLCSLRRWRGIPGGSGTGGCWDGPSCARKHVQGWLPKGDPQDLVSCWFPSPLGDPKGTSLFFGRGRECGCAWFGLGAL